MGADQPKASPLAKRIARPSPQGPPAPKAKGFRNIVWESNKGETSIFWAYFVFGFQQCQISRSFLVRKSIGPWWQLCLFSVGPLGANTG